MYIAGLIPAPLRQVCTAVFSGVVPINTAATEFEVFPVNGVMTYVDPNDHTDSALAQGGLYDFGSTPTKVLEIRALPACGNILAVIADRGDQKLIDLTVGGATPAIDLTALGVVAGDIITVTSAGIPLTETYTVDSIASASVVKVVELGSNRDLVALDTFTITNYDGTVTRYGHTLAGVDTLELAVSTVHDTSIGVAIASRLMFEVPPVITPAQVLKVSTVADDADGWIDVYAVKGDVY